MSFPAQPPPTGRRSRRLSNFSYNDRDQEKSNIPLPMPYGRRSSDARRVSNAGSGFSVSGGRRPSNASGMNRHSAQVFGDFQDFDNSKSRDDNGDAVEDDNEDNNDEDGREACTTTPDVAPDMKSSASSTYTTKMLPDPPYHIFTLAKKKQLVYIVSLAGLFSPLSSNIYFPALGQIAKDLKVSLSLVSLTVTIYMIVQGLAPSFWGPLSDTKGRRITFIGTFGVYLVSCVGLAFADDFTTLMIFRAIQAAGSAATISVGAGVIGDITTARERGGLIGIFGGIRMLGQSVGPVFGGIISEFLGFHAIFWFLFGLGGLTLFLVLLLLPETLRSIAGNGTVKLSSIHRPFIYKFTPSPDQLLEREPTPKKSITVNSIVAPLKFLFEKDVFITLFFGSIVYTVWSMVTSSTTALFQEPFGLNDLQVGLVFLPNGAGCIAGSYLTGYLMDYDYKITEGEYRADKGIATDVPVNKKELIDFPVEKSRLRNVWWIIVIFVFSTGVYGYSLGLEIMAIPLVLQFFIAYSATAVFSLNSALVIDLFPGASASATAVNNLARCSVGAAGVAAVQPIIDVLKPGPTFLLFAGLTLVLSPLLILEWFFGQRWRNERNERLARKEEAKKQSDMNEKQ